MICVREGGQKQHTHSYVYTVMYIQLLFIVLCFLKILYLNEQIIWNLPCMFWCCYVAEDSRLLCCGSVAKSCLSVTPRAAAHARLLYPPLSPGVYSNSCSLSGWCSLTISSSATPFSFSWLLHHLSFILSLSREWLSVRPCERGQKTKANTRKLCPPVLGG